MDSNCGRRFRSDVRASRAFVIRLTSSTIIISPDRPASHLPPCNATGSVRSERRLENVEPRSDAD